MQLQPARWDKSKLPASDDDDDVHSSRPSSPSERSVSPNASTRSLPPRMRLKEKKSPFEFRVIKQASATPSHSSSAASADRELVPIPSPPWAKSKPLPQENQPAEGRCLHGQKRKYASDDEGDLHVEQAHRMDVDTNERESGMNVDKRRKEDLEREREREKASRTLPPLPPFRPGHQGQRFWSYPGHDTRATDRPPPAPPRGYPEFTSPPFHPPVRYPPLPSGHPYHPPPPSTYRNGPPLPANYPPPYYPPPRRPPLPEQQSHFLYPQPFPPESCPPPRAYGPPPPQQAPPPLQPPPPKLHPPLPPNRHGSTTAQVNVPPSPPPPPPPHSQLLPSSTPYSYFHKIRLNRPSKPRSSTASSRQEPHTQPQENVQQERNDQTLYQQAAAARHAAYSSPGTVDSTTLTTHPVPYSIGVKAASSTAGMAGDAGRLVGEYEQHPLRQQTSYLPISAVGGAQFVLKPPRIPKTKASKLKFMVSGPGPTPVLPLGIETVVEPRPFQPNPEDILIEIKQEEELVTASVAAITIGELDEHMDDLATSDEEDELATPAVDDAGEDSNNNEVDGSTFLSLGSPPDFLSSETNTFAAPERRSPPISESPKQDSQTQPETPPTKDNVVKDSHPPTTMNKSPHLTNGQSFRQAASISFVEFRPPPPPTVKNVPSNPRPASANADGPAPMSAFTSTFPAQPPHLRQPRARAEYRVRYNAPILPPRQTTLPPPGPDVLGPPDSPLSVQVHVSSISPSSDQSAAAARTRRGPKPRRNDFDAVLDPSQTAAQGGQIRMRVLPQATYTPPVQPALAIMHEQPHVAKRKGKRTDGLVPEYGFVPREYVYRERE